MYARPGRRRPSPARLSGGIVWRLLVRHYRELIAYGAGWTDPEREQRVGDTGRHQPSGIDAIIDAELQRALADPDPQRGIAQLTARLAAAFVPDPAGVTRTMALGSERMERKLRDALPGGDSALRGAVWEFMRPILSAALVALNWSHRQLARWRTERHRANASLIRDRPAKGRRSGRVGGAIGRLIIPTGVVSPALGEKILADWVGASDFLCGRFSGVGGLRAFASLTHRPQPLLAGTAVAAM
jgi:hypothetical protein